MRRLLARWRGGVGFSPFSRLSWHCRVVVAPDSLVDCTQAGERLEVKELREALIADKTLVFANSKTSSLPKRHDQAINVLLVKWAREYYKRWKKNPKSVEGDAFAALDLEDYIRRETSLPAHQSNFTASTFDIQTDASSVRRRSGVVSSSPIWPALPAAYV